MPHVGWSFRCSHGNAVLLELRAIRYVLGRWLHASSGSARVCSRARSSLFPVGPRVSVAPLWLHSNAFRTRIVQVTDERVKIMSEIIRSMRIVKMYCWESAFERKIFHVRKYVARPSRTRVCMTFLSTFLDRKSSVALSGSSLIRSKWSSRTRRCASPSSSCMQPCGHWTSVLIRACSPWRRACSDTSRRPCLTSEQAYIIWRNTCRRRHAYESVQTSGSSVFESFVAGFSRFG